MSIIATKATGDTEAIAPAVSPPFTPTTQQVRDGFAHDPEAEYHDPTVNHSADNMRAFNRWLTQHDAEVAAAARSEALSDVKRTRASLQTQLDSFITSALAIHDVMKVVPHPYNAVADMTSAWAHDFSNFALGLLRDDTVSRAE